MGWLVINLECNNQNYPSNSLLSVIIKTTSLCILSRCSESLSVPVAGLSVLVDGVRLVRCKCAVLVMLLNLLMCLYSPWARVASKQHTVYFTSSKQSK